MPGDVGQLGYDRDHSKELTFDYGGAQALAYRLRAYWRTKGHEIETSIESVKMTASGHATCLYCVRSNLVNGLPPGMPA